MKHILVMAIRGFAIGLVLGEGIVFMGKGDWTRGITWVAIAAILMFTDWLLRDHIREQEKFFDGLIDEVRALTEKARASFEEREKLVQEANEALISLKRGRDDSVQN